MSLSFFLSLSDPIKYRIKSKFLLCPTGLWNHVWPFLALFFFMAQCYPKHSCLPSTSGTCQTHSALGILQLLFALPETLLPSSLRDWLALIIQTSVQMLPHREVLTILSDFKHPYIHTDTHTLTLNWLTAHLWLHFIFFKTSRGSYFFY